MPNQKFIGLAFVTGLLLASFGALAGEIFDFNSVTGTRSSHIPNADKKAACEDAVYRATSKAETMCRKSGGENTYNSRDRFVSSPCDCRTAGSNNDMYVCQASVTLACQTNTLTPRELSCPGKKPVKYKRQIIKSTAKKTVFQLKTDDITRTFNLDRAEWEIFKENILADPDAKKDSDKEENSASTKLMQEYLCKKEPDASIVKYLRGKMHDELLQRLDKCELEAPKSDSCKALLKNKEIKKKVVSIGPRA